MSWLKNRERRQIKNSGILLEGKKDFIDRIIEVEKEHIINSCGNKKHFILV